MLHCWFFAAFFQLAVIARYNYVIQTVSTLWTERAISRDLHKNLMNNKSTGKGGGEREMKKVFFFVNTTHKLPANEAHIWVDEGGDYATSTRALIYAFLHLSESVFNYYSRRDFVALTIVLDRYRLHRSFHLFCETTRMLLCWLIFNH